MNSVFVRSLDRFGILDAADRALIEKTLIRHTKRIDAGRDLILKGDKPLMAYLILDGWAYRYKALANRRRQIIAYLLPGDFSDLNIALLRHMDHSIATLTTVTVAELSQDVFDLFMSGTYPRITQAFWIKGLMDAAVQREWTVNLGQRSAPERIGHVLCELFHRLRAVGLTEGNQCFLPLTQSDLAETTGLSLVHVNKRLRDLRAAGLISLRGKVLTIPDLAALERASIFTADYLNVHESVTAG